MKKLLKNYISSSLLFIVCTKVQAQVNLVQDGSFEDTTVDWRLYWGEGILDKWHTFGNNYYVNNYVYFTSIISNIADTSFKLPYNNYFHTYPRNGSGTLNLGIYYKPVPAFPLGTPNMRTIVQNKLRTKLIAGKIYCVTSYVFASYRYGYVQTNGLQFYFDNGQIDTVYTIHKDSSGIYPQYQAQVSVPFVISDTSNWVKVQGTFVANGTETHVTMGNFRSDSATTIVVPPWINGGLAGSCRCQEVLVDDVSVIPIDLNNWLQDVYVTAGDSVWVGLDKLDMPDAVWYQNTIGTTPLAIAPGFWYKPESNSTTTFIQGIEVCGTMVYDTMQVHVVPLGFNNASVPNFYVQIYPNPSSNNFNIINNMSGEINIQISDILGKQYTFEKIPINAKQHTIKTNLSNGLYFVTITNESNETITKKLLIK